ncbi:MAG: DUF1064 domain-containing protein [Bacteroidota bacterium]
MRVKGRSKYHNVKTVVDGKTFASKKEAARYGVLRLLERQGHIKNLRLQVPYKIVVNGVPICTYRSDFDYEEQDKEVVEDSKGVHTPVFKIKQKLMKAVYGIEIKLT